MGQLLRQIKAARMGVHLVLRINRGRSLRCRDALLGTGLFLVAPPITRRAPEIL